MQPFSDSAKFKLVMAFNFLNMSIILVSWHQSFYFRDFKYISSLVICMDIRGDRGRIEINHL